MNLKKTLMVFGFPLMLAMTLPLYAQTGCDDSPEDPTIVLALVGAAGLLVAGARAAKKNREQGVGNRGHSPERRD
jgi:XrtJ-associated TM-motif-TM protein